LVLLHSPPGRVSVPISPTEYYVQNAETTSVLLSRLDSFNRAASQYPVSGCEFSRPVEVLQSIPSPFFPVGLVRTFLMGLHLFAPKTCFDSFFIKLVIPGKTSFSPERKSPRLPKAAPRIGHPRSPLLLQFCNFTRIPDSLRGTPCGVVLWAPRLTNERRATSRRRLTESRITFLRLKRLFFSAADTTWPPSLRFPESEQHCGRTLLQRRQSPLEFFPVFVMKSPRQAFNGFPSSPLVSFFREYRPTILFPSPIRPPSRPDDTSPVEGEGRKVSPRPRAGGYAGNAARPKGFFPSAVF